MTCDKCHKEIQEGEERYTSMEPKAFRHAKCHFMPPRAIPPAAESLRECAALGLVTINEDGSVTGHSQPCKMGWGYVELKRLVEALWPDIAPAGVDFEKVIARAKNGAALISRVAGYQRYLRLNRSLPLDQSQRLRKLPSP